ncbi:MAG: PhnD/SsuA/transferrin family substrate-binding protein [bacterium]|nr:PhnD/SsuA/transferrin family substrate-binding protein [bacterium]
MTSFSCRQFFILSCALFCLGAAPVQAETFKIGVLAKRGPEMAHAKWDATARYLTQAIPKHQFVIAPLGFDAVSEAVSNKEIDFLLVNPSMYVEMEVLHGASRIATLKNKGPGGAYTVFGGVVFTRSNRNDLQTISDLKKGYRFMAVNETSLGGFQLGWSELKKYGIDPYGDFTQLVFRSKHDQVVFAVLNGEVDAGTVRSDTLERMAAEAQINLDDFKILGKKTASKESGFPFLHSTILVPEWPFAKLSHISDAIAQKVTIALLEMEPDSEAAIQGKNEGWTVPLNYQPIRNLMIDLKIGPFRKFGQLTFQKIIDQYWLPIMASLLTLVVLMFILTYIWRINRRLKTSEDRLRIEATEKAEVERALEQQRDALEEQVKRVQATLQRLEKIEKYHDLTSFLIGSTQPEDLLNKALTRVVELSGSEFGTVFLWDGAALRPSVRYGLSEKNLDQSGLIGSLPELVLKERKPRHMTKLPASCLLEVGLGVAKIHPEEMVMLPLSVTQKLLGVMIIGGFKRYPPEDIPVLSHMSDQVSILLDNALTAEAIQHSTEELARANDTKNKFFSIISHDLRGPLGSMAMIFKLIEQGELELNDELVHNMAESTENIHQLLNDLLTWAQSQKGQLEFRPTALCLKSAVQETVGLLREMASNKGITIASNLSPQLYAQADLLMVTTVLRNLLSNAIKFSPAGQRIEVNAKPLGAEVLVEVRDFGTGISPEVQEKLFRLDKAVVSSPGTANEKGTGLGLVLCKEFVEINQGSIGVQSTLGQGSVFWFSLPLATSPQKPSQVPAKDYAGFKVLVAEDNPLHQLSTGKTLAQMNMEYSLAPDGEAALIAFGKEEFDLVLMDIDMPKLNGIEAAKRIKERSNKPIIALTSYSKEELLDSHIDGHLFDGYLNKPLSKEQLAHLLSGLSPAEA